MNSDGQVLRRLYSTITVIDYDNYNNITQSRISTTIPRSKPRVISDDSYLDSINSSYRSSRVLEDELSYRYDISEFPRNMPFQVELLQYDRLVYNTVVFIAESFNLRKYNMP